MKNWQITGFLAILILGFLLIGGCTSTAPTVTTSPPTTTSTAPAETTPVWTPTTITAIITPVIPTTLTTTIPASYTTNDINKHFVDIAFGPDYAFINKWPGDHVDIGISGNYNDADIILLNNFSKLFNSYSTTELAEVKEERKTANIVLIFLPESSLKNVNSDNSWKVSKNRETDKINFIYKTTEGVRKSETIYINSDLKGDTRTHWILRALLYELGFPGETGTYTNSIFYSDSETVTSLSKIDLKALELMYGKKISYGMTLTQVQQLLLIDNK
jgi:hypothetical protein